MEEREEGRDEAGERRKSPKRVQPALLNAKRNIVTITILSTHSLIYLIIYIQTIELVNNISCYSTLSLTINNTPINLHRF